MRYFSLPEQQVAYDAFAVNGIGDGLTHARVIERRALRVESEVDDVRAGKLFDLQPWSQIERLQSIRGEIGRQWYEINAPAPQLRLQRVGVEDDAHTQGLNLRRTLPVVRKRLHVNHLL